MKLTYYGHSCFEVEAGGKRLLFDPFIRQNPLARDVDLHTLAPHYILVSHGHSDHVADAAEIAIRTGATVISNFEITQWLAREGVPNLLALNHGGSQTLGFGRVKYVNAIHSSSMPDGSYGGNPGGFVLQAREATFYYSGDTALTLDMQLIGEAFKLDFAVLPIGDTYGMGVPDALRAAEFVKTRVVVGVHFNTFPVIQIDADDARRQFAQAGKRLILPELGLNEAP